MTEKTILRGLVFEQHISFIEVCKKLDISEDFILELLEHGLVENIQDVKNLNFDEKLINKIMKAQHFKSDLEVNTPGVMVILDLLDEVEQLRTEMDILKRHLDY